MRRLILLALLSLPLACKDQETQAVENRQRTTSDLVVKARAALADGENTTAVTLLKQAVAQTPNDAQLQILLAQAHREAGNETAAVLALKQAEELGARNDPAVKRARADLYKTMGQTKEAIATLQELAAANALTDAEILELARMQGHAGDPDGAFKTLERVQTRKPDDPEAKIAEAEILLVSGKEMIAAKLMDRLLDDNALFTAARVLRARYFLQNGYPDTALQDLDLVPEEDARRLDVLELRARVLSELKRYEEASKVLQPAIDANPRNAELLSLQAETRLAAGHPDEANALIDEALSVRARDPGALYVRGRAYEQKDDLVHATEAYQAALKSKPDFAPALSRMWLLYLEKGEKNNAISALERLFFLGQASADERVQLAVLYADTGNNLDRGKKLIDEALRVQPDNEKYKEVKKALIKRGAKTGLGGGGPIIIRRR